MNRPDNKSKWESYSVISPVYVKNLERYCEELESKLELAIGTNDILNDRINVFEKALDKESEKLAFASDERIIKELGSFQLGELNRTASEWREWAMKDE